MSGFVWNGTDNAETLQGVSPGTYNALAGADSIRGTGGFSGNDRIFGGEGNDTLRGGSGPGDLLDGGGGDDVLFLEGGVEAVTIGGNPGIIFDV